MSQERERLEELILSIESLLAEASDLSMELLHLDQSEEIRDLALLIGDAVAQLDVVMDEYSIAPEEK
ncbi:MAG TPA: hypothetical protein PKZ07_19030 [Sedimentisphaerales bacterium]|nr:hypothetical protein [Methanothrix sp.]HON93671.1 hypothetical protein [Sedimentisphaerales bacterium]